MVECPSAFPPGWEKKKPRNHNNQDEREKIGNNKNRDLDFRDVAKEIRELGSTTFTGYDKLLFKERKYEEITGMKKKREKTPIKILRAKKAKYAAKIEKIEKEAKESGIVLAKKKKEKRKFSEEKRKAEKSAGPVPSIGFMMKGTYRVNKNR